MNRRTWNVLVAFIVISPLSSVLFRPFLVTVRSQSNSDERARADCAYALTFLYKNSRSSLILISSKLSKQTGAFHSRRDRPTRHSHRHSLAHVHPPIVLYADTDRGSRKDQNNVGSSEFEDYDNVHVMVNGMPGPMATAAAEACLRKGLKLAPSALTGPDVTAQIIAVTDSVTGRSREVRLIPQNEKHQEEIAASIAGLKQAYAGRRGVGMAHLVVIDFTHPSAVNGNARLYVKERLPFVMGTTGGDRARLLQDVQAGNLSAVIAPNMGKQLVALQAALANAAATYPGAFAGYTLSVTESHQVTKADTSGTALDVISSITTLSSDTEFSTSSDIQMIRDEASAIEFGVPSTALKGHAFHTYTLTSPDGTVQFQLKHNVAGRTIYAEGTADAVKFLARKLKKGEEAPQIYTMINVLEEGALE